MCQDQYTTHDSSSRSRRERGNGQRCALVRGITMRATHNTPSKSKIWDSMPSACHVRMHDIAHMHAHQSAVPCRVIKPKMAVLSTFHLLRCNIDVCRAVTPKRAIWWSLGKITHIDRAREGVGRNTFSTCLSKECVLACKNLAISILNGLWQNSVASFLQEQWRTRAGIKHRGPNLFYKMHIK